MDFKFNLKKSGFVLLTLVLLLLIGACLRLYKINYKNLWYDEAKSISIAREFNIFNVWKEEDCIKPLFYFLVLKPWMYIFGANETSARLPSAILGILSLILIYKTTKLLFDTNTGLIASFLLAISPFAIYYSQQADYSGAKIFIVLISMYAFLKALQSQKWLLGLSIINTSIIFLHPACFFAVIVQNISVLLLRKDRYFLIKWLKYQIPALVSFVIWWIVFLQLDSLSRTTYWVDSPSASMLFRTLENFSYGIRKFAQGGSGFELSANELIIPRILLVIYFCLSSYGIYKGLKTNTKTFKNVLFTLIWLLIPVFSLFLFSILFFSIYSERYLMYCVSAYYILIAFGLKNITNKKVSLSLIVAITMLNIYCLDILYEPSKTQEIQRINSWKSIGKFIRKHAKPADIIVISPLRQIVPFWYYYKPEQKTNKNIDIMGNEISERWGTVHKDNSILLLGPQLGDFKNFVAKHKHTLTTAKNIWFVVSADWTGQKNVSEKFIEYFSKSRTLKQNKHFPYPGVDIYLFIPKNYSTKKSQKQRSNKNN